MKIIIYLIFGVLVIAIIGIILLSGFVELSPREYMFSSILLTGLAIGASWLGTNLTSRFNAEQMRKTLKSEYTDNLRTYALKAAEKVQNLSAEIGRLFDYVKESLPSSKDEAAAISVERFKTVGLMLETIKSVNDTGLSDWRGIIGDELKEQEQIQTDINNIFSKLEEIEESMTTPVTAGWEVTVPARLASVGVAGSNVDARLEDINRYIHEYASSSPIPVRLPKSERIEATVKCPKCKIDNTTKINLREGYGRVVRCDNCGNYFQVNVDKDMRINTDNVETKEAKVVCVVCDTENMIKYPVWQAYSLHHNCSKCTSTISAAVSGDEEIKFRQSGDMTKKFMEIIEQLTEGKYPDEGKVSEITKVLGVRKSKVAQCVRVLLNLGRMEVQEEEEDEEEDEEESENI